MAPLSEKSIAINYLKSCDLFSLVYRTGFQLILTIFEYDSTTPVPGVYIFIS